MKFTSQESQTNEIARLRDSEKHTQISQTFFIWNNSKNLT